MGILIIYLVILLTVSILSYRKGFQNIFRTDTRLPWYLAGFSIFMINPETTTLLSKMGIVATEGYAGMWIFYSGVMGADMMLFTWIILCGITLRGMTRSEPKTNS